jgi:hypothetical protein
MHRIRTIHLIIGVLGLASFILTGQYMHWFHGHLREMADGPRLLYRSAHIYLLWSSLLNLLLGCYLSPLRNGSFRGAQLIAGLAILLGPLLLTASFFIESNNPGLARPIARLAIYLALAGGGLHAMSALGSRIGYAAKIKH